jgi:hypothetical protein
MDEKLKNKMTFIPVDVVTKPKDGVFIIRTNYYWSVIEHNGQECIMLYCGSSPQCNSQLDIVESINERLYPAKIVQLPVVFLEWKD